MGNGDIGSDKPNLGGPNSVPGGEVIEARPQLTEEELKEKNEREEAERKK